MTYNPVSPDRAGWGLCVVKAFWSAAGEAVVRDKTFKSIKVGR